MLMQVSFSIFLMFLFIAFVPKFAEFVFKFFFGLVLYMVLGPLFWPAIIVYLLLQNNGGNK